MDIKLLGKRSFLTRLRDVPLEMRAAMKVFIGVSIEFLRLVFSPFYFLPPWIFFFFNARWYSIQSP